MLWKYPYYIRFIKNPTEEMKEIACFKNPHLIRFIKDKTERIQLFAIRQKFIPNIIGHIKNPSVEVQKAAIDHFSHSILHIKKPSEEIKEYALEQNPYLVISNVNLSDKEKNRKYILKKLSYKPMLIYDLKEVDEEILTEVSKKHPHVIGKGWWTSRQIQFKLNEEMIINIATKSPALLNSYNIPLETQEKLWEINPNMFVHFHINEEIIKAHYAEVSEVELARAFFAQSKDHNVRVYLSLAFGFIY